MSERNLKLKRIITDNGSIENAVYEPDALKLPGYIPVRVDGNTIYINSEKVVAMIVDDNQQENMRSNLIEPKEYRLARW